MINNDNEQAQIASKRNILVRDDITCCGNEMIDLGSEDYDTLIDYRHIWICGSCGHLKEFVSYDLDDEVLCNFIKHYKDDLRYSEIYSEMMGGGRHG